MGEIVWNGRGRHAPARTRMVAMVRNPKSAFVYWEIDDTRRAMVERHFQCHWVRLPKFLCLYDVTEAWFDGYNAPLVMKQAIACDTRSWYLRDLQPNRSYVADIATTTLEDRLFCIVRSNVLTTPRNVGGTSRSREHSAARSYADHYPYEAVFDGYVVHEAGVPV